MAKPIMPPAKPSPATPAAAGQIDWPALLARYSGHLSFIDKLAHLALENHSETPAKLRAAAASGDQQAVGFLAHKIKSLGGNFSALPLAALANEAETAAKLGRDDTHSLAGELAESLEELLAELSERLKPCK